MKKLLLSSIALASFTLGAAAADLPSRRSPAPFVAVPVFTWTGFYVGVNAGYGFSDNSNRTGNLTAVGPFFNSAVTPVGGGAFVLDNRNNRDGFVGGGQLGYNYQIGSFVIGLEGDIQYTDFGRRSGTTVGQAVANVNIAPGNPNVAFFNRGNQSDFYGTVRGRLGYAMDRVLVYGTGGVAFRDTSNTTFSAFGFNRTTGRGEDVGYAAGGGVEYAFTPNLTARVEGMYVNFEGSRSNVVGVTNTGAAIVSDRRRSDDDFGVVRAGINYKFNSFLGM